MDKELQMLININDNEHITQRQLAKKLSLSLGTINALLQRMIDKGYINVVQSNTRVFRYYLTPLGVEVKNKKTYDHIVISYNIIGRVRTMTKKFILEQIEKGITKFYIYGKHDEVYKIVKMSIIEAKRAYNLQYFEVDELTSINSEGVVITWNNNLNIENNSHELYNILDDVI
ncbi:MAG: winged helix-turn-helix transcriptional regulator [Vallitalea sp.]|jgi:DNA-binding MarR family transcriptional regulator|nr:winged helix-turn-helix transcriptional regulator [Vallitalea sp.]